jgi:Ca2+-binding EF-hand superfamily protein
LSDEEVEQIIGGQGDSNGLINISEFVRYILQA